MGRRLDWTILLQFPNWKEATVWIIVFVVADWKPNFANGRWLPFHWLENQSFFLVKVYKLRQNSMTFCFGTIDTNGCIFKTQLIVADPTMHWTLDTHWILDVVFFSGVLYSHWWPLWVVAKKTTFGHSFCWGCLPQAEYDNGELKSFVNLYLIHWYQALPTVFFEHFSISTEKWHAACVPRSSTFLRGLAAGDVSEVPANENQQISPVHQNVNINVFCTSKLFGSQILGRFSHRGFSHDPKKTLGPWVRSPGSGWVYTFQFPGPQTGTNYQSV